MKSFAIKVLAAGILAACTVAASVSCDIRNRDDYEIEEKDVRAEELGKLYTEVSFSEEALTDSEKAVAAALCKHLDTKRAEAKKFESAIYHNCDSKLMVDGVYYYFIKSVAGTEDNTMNSTKYIISTDFIKMHTVEVDNNPDELIEIILRIYTENFAGEDLEGFSAE